MTRTETLIGTFQTREAAAREGQSIQSDAPEGVTIELRINDDTTWSLVEVEGTDDEPTTTVTYNTLAEIKAANKAAGHHFFDADTLRFFRSRIAPGVIGGRFFVTSEQFVDSQGVASPREYSIREVDAQGHITTVGDFQRFSTLDEARTEARRLAAQAQS